MKFNTEESQSAIPAPKSVDAATNPAGQTCHRGPTTAPAHPSSELAHVPDPDVKSVNILVPGSPHVNHNICI